MHRELLPQMEIHLSKIEVTKFMLLEQFKQSYSDGVQYSQFY